VSQAELDDTIRMKKEREDALMVCKRQLAEAQLENTKYGKAIWCVVGVPVRTAVACLSVAAAIVFDNVHR